MNEEPLIKKINGSFHIKKNHEYNLLGDLMDEVERIKANFKNKKYISSSKKINLNSYILKVLLVGVITLSILIGTKSNEKFKVNFYKKVYQESISFVSIDNMYKKIFGTSIPFKNLFHKEITPVFKETIKYKESSIYKDGVKLTVEENYMVPSLETGMVIFIGDKEGYGKTIIVEQVNGIEVWYSNLQDTNLKMYDYIEKGSLIGSIKESTLYMVFQKDGKNLNYEDYI